MTSFWRGLWATLRTRTRPAMAWPYEWDPKVDELARKQKHLKVIREIFEDEHSCERHKKIAKWWLIYYGEDEKTLLRLLELEKKNPLEKKEKGRIVRL